jgi:hypothetical protein
MPNTPKQHELHDSTCSRSSGSRRGAATSLVIVIGLITGCQDQSALPSLGASSANDPHLTASRLLFMDLCQDAPGKPAVVRDLLRSVNAERAKARLAPLRLNDTLNQVADFYACRLIEGDFFSHVDPYDGSTVDARAAHFGYPFLKIGENLAAGQQSVEQVVAEWMNSPGHRANLLDPAFVEIGMAVKVGGKLGVYWVQEFGRPVTDGEWVP